MKTEWPGRIARGEVTQTEAARLMGWSRPNVTRWMAAWEADVHLEAERGRWAQANEVQHWLQGPLSVEAFVGFRSHLLGRETGPAQRLWAEAVIDAVNGGLRQLVLMHPRAGKTTLLQDLVLFLIARNPSVRILWVSSTQDLAERSTGAILEELSENEALRAAVLGPGERWKPSQPREWSASSFTVVRPVIGMKAATVTALGRGGKILGRDCDVLIADDPCDYDSTRSPVQRESDAIWFSTQLMSRKTAETAVVVLGSRQHPQDLYSGLLESGWRAVISPAHDPECELPMHDLKGGDEHGGGVCPVCDPHDAAGCMPDAGLRSMQWLVEARADLRDERRFQMNYMQIPTEAGGPAMVSAEELEACRNPARRAGEFDRGSILLAGLDPAAQGQQAAVLWSYEPWSGRWLVVDAESVSPGGREPFRDVMLRWAAEHGCRRWHLEANGAHGFLVDGALADEAARAGILLVRTVTTAPEKWDEQFGVPAMLDAFRAGLMDTPWGDEAGRAVTRLLEGQILAFDRATARSIYRVASDVVMAAWFPWSAAAQEAWTATHIVNETSRGYVGGLGSSIGTSLGSQLGRRSSTHLDGRDGRR